MIEVEIKGIVVTHQYGTLNTGDVLRTDPEFAKHLVEDCGAATYRTLPIANADDVTAQDSSASVQLDKAVESVDAKPDSVADSPAPAGARPGRKPKAP